MDCLDVSLNLSKVMIPLIAAEAFRVAEFSSTNSSHPVRDRAGALS